MQKKKLFKMQWNIENKVMIVLQNKYTKNVNINVQCMQFPNL